MYMKILCSDIKKKYLDCSQSQKSKQICMTSAATTLVCHVFIFFLLFTQRIQRINKLVSQLIQVIIEICIYFS